MSAQQRLHQAYREWHRLAVAEGNAIREGNWSFVHDCQAAVLQLREQIDSLNPRAYAEWNTPGNPCSAERAELRSLVNELIALERKNKAALEARRKKMREQLEGLGQSRLNLRRLRESYVGPAPAAFSAVLGVLLTTLFPGLY